MSTTHDDVLNWRGRNAVDNDGDKLGEIEEIYLDANSGRPEWLAIRTGLFGTKQTFVPSAEATEAGDEIRVPYAKATVKDAPNIDADGRLSETEEQALYAHYGLGYESGDLGSGTGVDTDIDTTRTDVDRDTTTGRGDIADDTSGPNTDDAMTRSEEELKVGTTQRETGRVRLRKHIVTENVQTTVPVSREEVRIEREPITDANVDAATSGKDLSEEEAEMTLHEEEIVTEKRVVPKERVSLQKDTVTEERSVNEEVRKERIESDGVDGDIDGGSRR